MISSSTYDLQINRAISENTRVVNDTIDTVLHIFENIPSWYGTCEKIQKIKAMYHTSLRYKALNKAIEDFQFFIVVDNLSRNEDLLVRKIEVVNLKDPIIKSLGSPTAQTIVAVLQRSYAIGGVFALISSKAKEALNDLIRQMEKAGMGAVYEFQLRILDGATLPERLNYLTWFRNQRLHNSSVTALAAFSMCVSSVHEMNEAELLYWQGRFPDMCAKFNNKANVYLHLMELKKTNRNCTCAIV